MALGNLKNRDSTLYNCREVTLENRPDNFLRDSWYAAAWPGEVGQAPLRRIFLNRPITLFRDRAGQAIALSDRCPHRLLPLSYGTVKGDAIQCGYHGLQFGRDGLCTHNPQGDGMIPHNARVQSFPLAEKYGALWIWMGAPDRADTELIPEFQAFGDPSRYALATGRIVVGANYQLVTDNLLDLSHVDYLHPGLKSRGDPINRREVRQDGNTVWSMSWRYGALPNTSMQRFWPADKAGDMHAHMRWDPPALMLLDVGMGEPGCADSAAFSRLSAHLLTPETETSTHYFWAFRCAAGASEELKTANGIGIQAFANEDRPVLELQQANLGLAELRLLDRGLLASDAATIRARRVLQQRISHEALAAWQHATSLGVK
jgi:phenylpropionate dioxygenase-like ring-hydroxylating dioxygenase large terminal subunit